MSIGMTLTPTVEYSMYLTIQFSSIFEGWGNSAASAWMNEFLKAHWFMESRLLTENLPIQSKAELLFYTYIYL